MNSLKKADVNWEIRWQDPRCYDSNHKVIISFFLEDDDDIPTKSEKPNTICLRGDNWKEGSKVAWFGEIKDNTILESEVIRDNRLFRTYHYFKDGKMFKVSEEEAIKLIRKKQTDDENKEKNNIKDLIRGEG